MGKELPAMNNYTWHIFFGVLRTTVQAGQDTILKYSLGLELRYQGYFLTTFTLLTKARRRKKVETVSVQNKQLFDLVNLTTLTFAQVLSYNLR